MRRLNLAAFFRKCREAKGLSQVELARILGVTSAHVCDFESGRRTLALNRLEDLLSALSVTPEQRARVYQSYGVLPEHTTTKFLEVPELWDLDPHYLMKLHTADVQRRKNDD